MRGQSRSVSGSDMLVKYIKRLYDKEFLMISEHIYRSIRLRGEYSYLSDLFNTLAEQEAYDFRTLGDMLLSLGVDPKVQPRARNGYGGENVSIEKILQYEADVLEKYLSELGRVMTLCRGGELYLKLDEIYKRTGEWQACLLRMLRS